MGFKGAHPTPQPVKLGMMQPKERVIRREADCHALAILLRQALRAVSRQVAPNEVVYMVVQQCHCVLESEEVARGLLGRVAHEVRAEGAVLWQLVGVPAGYERQVPPQRVWNRPGKFKVPRGRGKSSSSDGTVRIGGGVAVTGSAEPVLRGVLEHGGAEQVCVIARPVPVWRWPTVAAIVAEGGVE